MPGVGPSFGVGSGCSHPTFPTVLMNGVGFVPGAVRLIGAGEVLD
jgi:hypothetical protein